MKWTFESHVAEFKREIDNGMERVLEDVGKEVRDRAKELCPVDTGNLRDSIEYEAAEESVSVYSDVEYAAYVELGTYKMAAQPYLRPALEEAGHMAIKALEEEF